MNEPSSPTAAAPAAERIDELLQLLHLAYPGARCELNFRNPFELLIATILSAQCTDERVNAVTPALFARFPTPQTLAEADSEELEELIHSTGFFRNKAKNIQGACRRLVVAYEGQVPASMEELLTLPGVARKTANVVLGNGFGIADGVVVDTHVSRLAGRLGLSTQTVPDKIERDLMALVPQEEWVTLGNRLILHGRRVCSARKPLCSACTIRHLCPSADLL